MTELNSCMQHLGNGSKALALGIHVLFFLELLCLISIVASI